MVEPLTGANWFWECSHLNTDGLEAYLSEFSQAYPDDLHIIQLDNARFHPAKRVVIPHNLRLWFQPPQAPECNPIERLWAYLKGRLSWKLFDGLDQLQDHLATLITQISNEILASITGKSA